MAFKKIIIIKGLKTTLKHKRRNIHKLKDYEDLAVDFNEMLKNHSNGGANGDGCGMWIKGNTWSERASDAVSVLSCCGA
jgi:hypothetical protein